MTHAAGVYATLDDWIAHEALPFSLDSRPDFNAAVDQVIDSPGDSVALLGFGEALHGGEELLVLRNQLFQRLVEAHGYSAIAIESSFPRGPIVNEYVLGRGPASYEAVQDTGFSYSFGKFEANRELVEWMRHYNADPAHQVKLQFYGFDSPTDMITDSPRQTLHFVLDYLSSVDEALAQEYRSRIEPLLGQDSAWMEPLNARSFTDFDWFAVLDTTAYARGVGRLSKTGAHVPSNNVLAFGPSTPPQGWGFWGRASPAPKPPSARDCARFS